MYMIDYGFAKDIDDRLIKKYETNSPNMKFMILGLILKLKDIYKDHNPDIEYKALSKMLWWIFNNKIYRNHYSLLEYEVSKYYC